MGEYFFEWESGVGLLYFVEFGGVDGFFFGDVYCFSCSFFLFVNMISQSWQLVLLFQSDSNSSPQLSQIPM